MNRTALISLIVVALVVAVGLFLAFGKHALSPSESADTNLKPAPAAPTGNDTSDDALIEDTAAIDAELGGFEEDNASVESGLNDVPVSQ